MFYISNHFLTETFEGCLVTYKVSIYLTNVEIHGTCVFVLRKRLNIHT
jgi:hypothetical protein